MNQTPPARQFEPSVLEWARKQAGWTVELLAEKLSASLKDVSPDTVRNWEDGLAAPHPAHIKKLAEIYKRPVAVFLLASPPDAATLPPDRRSLKAGSRKAFSPKALLAIRRARRIQELAAELEEELEQPREFSYQRYRVNEDPAGLATQMRRVLAIRPEDQRRFRTYSGFFEFLRDRIEATGIITLRAGGHNGFPIGDARALSFVDRQPYVILINNQDTEGAKNFSLMHEFAHVLVREAGICNNFRSFTTRRGQIDGLEVFCNQFAVSFLVPAEALLAHRTLRGRDTVRPEELESVVRILATDHKVSRFVILRRLLSVGLIDRRQYSSKAEEWESEPIRKKKGGKSVPAKTAVLNNGLAFSSLVVEAYRREKLSYAGVSDYLGVKSKHLPAVERLVQPYER